MPVVLVIGGIYLSSKDDVFGWTNNINTIISTKGNTIYFKIILFFGGAGGKGFRRCVGAVVRRRCGAVATSGIGVG